MHNNSTQIVINRNIINETVANRMARTIANSKIYKCIIYNSKIIPGALTHFTHALRRYKHGFTYIFIHKVDISIDILQEFRLFLQANTMLKHLYLPFCEITNSTLLQILMSIKRNSRIQSLNFANNAIDDLGVAYINEFVHTARCNLIRLNLSGNIIRSFINLAEIIRASRNIAHLDVSKNKIISLSHISNALHNNRLAHLNISGNPIGCDDESYKAIRDIIELSNVHVLNTASCCIDNRFISLLLHNTKFIAQKLNVWHLDDNCIGLPGATALFSAIDCNCFPLLTILTLAQNRLGDVASCLLARCAPRLQTLDLRFNNTSQMDFVPSNIHISQ